MGFEHIYNMSLFCVRSCCGLYELSYSIDTLRTLKVKGSENVVWLPTYCSLLKNRSGWIWER